jgi:hypothetical protein
MNTLVDLILNWGYSNPGAIQFAGSTEPVFIDSAQWRTFSITSVSIILGIVALGIAACYLFTRRVGQAFVRRWWLFAVIVALAGGCSVFFYLVNSPFIWDQQALGIPTGMAFTRALLAVVQGIVYFYLLSALACVIFGRFLGVRAFVNNSQIPVPHIL